MNDFAQMEQKFDPKGGLVQFGTDERMHVEFYTRPVLNQKKSIEAGMAVHDPVDYIKMMQPHETGTVIDKPATPDLVRRFPRHWQLYQEGRAQRPEGTPLNLLFPVNPEIVANLEYGKVFTIQTLAGLNDTQIGNMGLGGRKFVDMAKAYVAAGQKGGDYHALATKVEQLTADRAADKEKIAALEAALAEKTEERRGPGRPPKAAVAA